MQPAETETATATKATQKGAEAKAKGPTPLEKEIHGPLAPFAEAPTFSVPPHAAPAATTATTAGGRPVGVAPVMGEMETMAPFPQPEPRLPMTFETTPPAGGLGLGAASSPLLGTSAAGLGETLGKTPETMEEEQEETVVPEKAGAGVGPSPTAGVSLLSPAKAAEAINKGIEQGEHALEVCVEDSCSLCRCDRYST